MVAHAPGTSRRRGLFGYHSARIRTYPLRGSDQFFCGWRKPKPFGPLSGSEPIKVRPWARVEDVVDSRSYREERMGKPRIFLGSSAKQGKLLQALTRGLEDVALVEPWTTSFNPGTTTLERLLELTREVDFAAFVSLGTTGRPPAHLRPSPRDPARLLRETTWSSKPDSSAAPSGCAEPSSSIRVAQSSRAISSVSRACDTAKRRPLPR